VTAALDPLGIRARLGRDQWGPPEEWGDAGWRYIARRGPTRSILVTCASWPDDGREWVHASISHPQRMPSYEELQALHHAVWPQGWAYQVFAPPEAHISGVGMGALGHPHALHLWGLLSGEPVLPNFGRYGHI
jgi:hypothetical protein